MGHHKNYYFLDDLENGEVSETTHSIYSMFADLSETTHSIYSMFADCQTKPGKKPATIAPNTVQNPKSSKNVAEYIISVNTFIVYALPKQNGRREYTPPILMSS